MKESPIQARLRRNHKLAWLVGGPALVLLLSFPAVVDHFWGQGADADLAGRREYRCFRGQLDRLVRACRGQRPHPADPLDYLDGWAR